MARIASRRGVPRSVRPAVDHSSETMKSAKGDDNAVGRTPAASLLRQQSGPSLKRYAEAKLAARLKRISSTLRRAAQNPEDPENIHHLRVAIRRFTQALRVFKDLLD